jgi:hypothetical protein
MPNEHCAPPAPTPVAELISTKRDLAKAPIMQLFILLMFCNVCPAARRSPFSICMSRRYRRPESIRALPARWVYRGQKPFTNDAVVIATDHDAVDYQALCRRAKLVIDTRNACARQGCVGEHIVKA